MIGIVIEFRDHVLTDFDPPALVIWDQFLYDPSFFLFCPSQVLFAEMMADLKVHKSNYMFQFVSLETRSCLFHEAYPSKTLLLRFEDVF